MACSSRRTALSRFRRTTSRGLVVAILGIAGLSATIATAQQASNGESEAGRARLAQTDAEALIADLQLPEGAAVASSDPSTGQALTSGRDAERFKHSPGQPEHAYAERFWRVQGEPKEVIVWIEAHAPNGGTRFLTSNPPEVTGFQFAPSQPRVIYKETLEIAAQPAEGGGTALRALAGASWFPVRPGSEHIPRGVQAIRILEQHRSFTPEGASFSASRTIRKPAAIEKVIRAVEALEPPAPANEPPCSAVSETTSIEVRFLGSPRGEPLAKLLASGDCEPLARIWVGTKEEPNLSAGWGLMRLLERLIGLRQSR